jgi:hypothetical protein
MTTAQILSLPLQTSSRLLRASDTGATYHIAAGQTGAAATTFPLNQEDLQLLLADEALANRTALELDDGEGNLPVQGIVLANTGNVSKDEGVISENSDGQMIRHDGISDGDELPYLEYGWRLSGYQEITAPQNQAGVVREIGRITIPASLAVLNQQLLVTGTISVEHSAGTNVPSYIIGFVPEGVVTTPGDGVGIGYLNNLSDQAQLVPTFYLRLGLFADTISTYALAPYIEPVGVVVRGNNGAAPVLSVSQLAAQGTFLEVGPLAVTHDLILYYRAPATPSAPSTKMTVNLRIIPL